MRDLSSPPSSWYSPLEGHEICTCEGCHEEDCHTDTAFWAKQGCEDCQLSLEEREIVH